MKYDNTWGYIVITVIVLIFICGWKIANFRHNTQQYRGTPSHERLEGQPTDVERGNNLPATESTPVVDKDNDRNRLYTIHEY